MESKTVATSALAVRGSNPFKQKCSIGRGNLLLIFSHWCPQGEKSVRHIQQALHDTIRCPKKIYDIIEKDGLTCLTCWPVLGL